jgi:protein-S-isoprenylcysteine O-methyltransferase Ste14
MAGSRFLSFKKLRFFFAWPFAMAVAVLAEAKPWGFVAGLPLIAAGELLRIWSQGSITKSVRLSVSGPYAHTRNPLYLANGLLGAGFLLLFLNGWLLVMYGVGFFWLYRGTIRDEEDFLGKQFGSSYQDYREHVPRFIPSWQRYAGAHAQPFDWQLVAKHGEPITFLTVFALLDALYLRMAWSLEGGSSELVRHAGFLGTGGVLIFLILACVLHRKFKGV